MIPKPSLPQLATMLTIVGLLIGWYLSYSAKVEEGRKNHDQQVIFQHDFEQRVDSLVNLQATSSVRLETLRKSREESLEKTAVHEKEQDKELIELQIEIKVLKQQLEDYMRFKK